MKNRSFLIVVLRLSVYFQKVATTDAETVWLKDVTTRLSTDKRTVSDTDLPDHLSFHLKCKSRAVTLNLKRNYQIDPNADIYIVRNLKNGQSVLEKSQNLENKHVAYYQDRENGAYMTVRCVKRSIGQCDRVINGNIRIGKRNYDLRPSKVDVKSRNFLEITGLLGKRYVLQHQGNILRKMAMEYEEKININARNVEEKLTDLRKHIPHGQDKHKHFSLPDVKLSDRNIGDIHNKGRTGHDIYRRTYNKNDKIRSQMNYYVDAAVLLDSGIWDLFLTMSKSTNCQEIVMKAKMNVRRYFSHIMNGVDLLYKGIEDASISISVYVRAFVIFQYEADFPHNMSKVTIEDGTKMIDENQYISDLFFWDVNTGSKTLPEFDQAILFTRYKLYEDTVNNTGDAGLSIKGYICEIGGRVQIVHVADYFMTVITAAHELGHSLGADHDGEDDAKACKAEDHFIMSFEREMFDPAKEYSRNPWLFSNCSVEAFKKTLPHKTCVASKGVYSQDELDEWNRLMKKLPGELYGPDEQCHIFRGFGSTYCGTDLSMICRFMYCTDPKTHRCENIYLSSATGTTCGPNMVKMVV